MAVRSPRRRKSLGSRILNVVIVILVAAIVIVGGIMVLNIMDKDRTAPAVETDASAVVNEPEVLDADVSVLEVEPAVEEEPAPPAPTIKVCLDAGHGGKDPGCDYQKGGETVKEKDETLQMVLAIRDAMEAQGIEVIMTRDDDTFVELEERAAIANRAGVDYFISIHRNTIENAHANGVEMYYAPGASEETMAFAANVDAALADVGVTRDRGVQEASMAVCRMSEMPAILVEMGFVVDDEDNKLFYDNMNAYAEAITDAVLDSYEEFHGENAE